MKIEDNRNPKEASIGDIIITDRGSKYILLINDGIDAENVIAVCNIEQDYIDFTTRQKVFCVAGIIGKETIVEIIPKSKVKIVIEK